MKGNLEEVEGISYREEEVGIRREREESLQGSTVLRRNGVTEAIEIFCYPSVCFPHAQVSH